MTTMRLLLSDPFLLVFVVALVLYVIGAIVVIVSIERDIARNDKQLQQELLERRFGVR